MFSDDIGIDLGGLWLGGNSPGNVTEAFLRKVDRQTDWGNSTEDEGDPTIATAKVVFRPEDSAFSLYRVKSPADLHVVLGGLAGNRGNPSQNIDAVFFTKTELIDVGIELLWEVDGELTCHAANRFHLDVRSEQRRSFLDLCGRSIQAGRQVKRFSKKQVVKGIIEERTDYGCEAFGGEPTTCQCRLPATEGG